MTKHAKAPWRIGTMESGQVAIESADDVEVIGWLEFENARRIVACVNACAGEVKTAAVIYCLM